MSGINASLLMLGTSGGWIATIPDTSIYAQGSYLQSATVSSDGNKVYFVGGYTDGTGAESGGVIYDFAKGGYINGTYSITDTANNPAYILSSTTDSSGNLIVDGWINNATNGITISLASNLSSINWQKVISATYLISSSYDNSGNVYVSGPNTGNNNARVVKYNSSGVLQFQKDIATANVQTYVTAAANPSTGEYYLAFRENSTTAQVFLFYFNAAGTTNTWKRVLNKELYPGQIVVDSSANVYISATPLTGLTFDVSKISSAGTTAWNKTLTITNASFNNAYVGGVAVDSTGNSYVCIAVANTGYTAFSVYLVKLDSTGALIWQRQISNSGNTVEAYGTSITVDSEFLYLPLSVGVGGSVYSALAVKYPLNGSATGTFGSYTIASTTSVSIANNSTSWTTATATNPTSSTKTDSSGTATRTSLSNPSVTLNRLS